MIDWGVDGHEDSVIVLTGELKERTVVIDVIHVHSDGDSGCHVTPLVSGLSGDTEPMYGLTLSV